MYVCTSSYAKFTNLKYIYLQNVHVSVNLPASFLWGSELLCTNLQAQHSCWRGTDDG